MFLVSSSLKAAKGLLTCWMLARSLVYFETY